MVLNTRSGLRPARLCEAQNNTLTTPIPLRGGGSGGDDGLIGVICVICGPPLDGLHGWGEVSSTVQCVHHVQWTGQADKT